MHLFVSGMKSYLLISCLLLLKGTITMQFPSLVGKLELNLMIMKLNLVKEQMNLIKVQVNLVKAQMNLVIVQLHSQLNFITALCNIFAIFRPFCDIIAAL